MSNKNQLPGGINVTDLTLHTKKGNVSLMGMFMEISLYEDISSSSLSGQITILDTVGLIQDLPLEGAEGLDITFNTPNISKDFEVKQQFIVYKIDSRAIIKSHEQSYVLHFITPEAFYDAGLKLSKAYNGTADKVIPELLVNTLKTKKKISVVPADNTIKLVSPFWSPMKVISYYINNSINGASKYPSYLFYETTNSGYRMARIDQLMKQKAKVEYTYDNDPLRKDGTRDTEAGYTQILELDYGTFYDELSRIDKGLHANTSYMHDLLTKNITKKTYSYLGSFDKFERTGKYPLIDDVVTKPRIVTHKTTYSKVHDTMPFDYSGYVRNMRLPLLNDMELLTLHIKINGRTDLNVGDIIGLKLGKYKQLDTQDAKNNEDKYYSGKYIILSVHHRIAMNQHMMYLTIGKNAVDQKIHG